MTVTAIVGAQWGDEGKGRIVDYLAQRRDGDPLPGWRQCRAHRGQQARYVPAAPGAIRHLQPGHALHHRGQLTTYLRAMGAAVPAVYGDSADEPMKM